MLLMSLGALAAIFGCGEESDTGLHGDGYALAEQIVADDIARYGGESPPPTPQLASADCTLTVSTDEYGFETEELTCASEEPQAAPDDTHPAGGVTPLTPADIVTAKGFVDPGYLVALLDFVPDSESRAALGDLATSISEVEAACGRDLERWNRELVAYAVTAEQARAVIEEASQSGRLEGFVGSVEAKAVSRVLVERALMESGCAEPGGFDSSTSADPAMLTMISQVATHTVGIDNLLRASSYGPLFHLYSSFPMYQWMRNETADTEVALVGTSQLGAGIDVEALGARLDRTVGSVWIPGALAEVQEIWLDEVLHYIDPEVMVWFVGPLDLFTECAAGERGAEFQRLLDARAATFARSGLFAPTADPMDRILGPAQPASTARGNGIKRDGLDVDGISQHREQYLPDFALGHFCHGRAKMIADTASRLTAGGRRVVVVGMPVHPELRAARPPGALTVADLGTTYLESIDGVRFIDLSESMADESYWSDFTHLTAEGADRFTANVADSLGRQP